MSTVSDNRVSSRFELYENGVVAGFVDYRFQGSELWLLSTEVTKGFGRKSVNEKMFSHILAEARRRRLAVRPFCAPMRTYIQDRPELTRLVPPEFRAKYKMVPAAHFPTAA